MFKVLVTYSIILTYLTPAILSLPATNPGFLSLTVSSLLQPNTTHQNITRLRDDALDCIKKPRMYHIDVQICKPTMDRLLAAPGAQTQQAYTAATTTFSGSPCHMQMKRARGEGTMVLSYEDLVSTATWLLNYCDKYQGAGWAQFFPNHAWYLLIYGDPR